MSGGSLAVSAGGSGPTRFPGGATTFPGRRKTSRAASRRLDGAAGPLRRMRFLPLIRKSAPGARDLVPLRIPRLPHFSKRIRRAPAIYLIGGPKEFDLPSGIRCDDGLPLKRHHTGLERGMTATSGQGEDRRAARQARLADALRANLRRRKAQEKGRMLQDAANASRPLDSPPGPNASKKFPEPD